MFQIQFTSTRWLSINHPMNGAQVHNIQMFKLLIFDT